METEIGSPLTGLAKFLAGSDPLESLGELADFVDVANAAVIGKGGSGVVLVASDKGSHSKLAVKVMSLTQACDDQTDVRREVQVMHQLQPHPNLVQLFGVMVCRHQLPGVNIAGPYLCIAMRYIANAEPLAKIIRRNGAQPGMAARIVPQLASALAMMHRLGKVHRDVWSENVLVQENGRAVLVDFGSAEDFRVWPDSRAPLNIPYMSPEAAKRLRQHPGDDSWSFGLLISEMLTGRFVVERLDSPTIPIHHHVDCFNELLVDVSEHSHTPLGRVCLKLLDLNASARLSMDDVLSALNAQGTQRTSLAQSILPISPHSVSRSQLLSPSPSPSLRQSESTRVLQGPSPRCLVFSSRQSVTRAGPPVPKRDSAPPCIPVRSSSPSISRCPSESQVESTSMLMTEASRSELQRSELQQTQHSVLDTEELTRSFVAKLQLGTQLTGSATHIARQARQVLPERSGGASTEQEQVAVIVSAIFIAAHLLDVPQKPGLAALANISKIPENAIKDTYDKLKPHVDTLLSKASAPLADCSKIRSQLCPGTPVEYFSVSAEECWIPAIILAYNADTGLYDLDCKAQVPRSKIRCPDPFPTGALVEYKSSKKGGWIPGRVLSFNAATGVYDLSCRAQAQRRRLRWPTGSHMAALSENCYSTYLAGGVPLSTLADVGDALDEIDATIIGRNPIEAVFMGCKICGRSNFAARVISLGVGSDNPAGVRQEIQIMSALQLHPNIVKLAGVMVCTRQLKHVTCPGPYLCILMQCLGSMCLLSETIRRGASKAVFIETVITQLASALSFVHQQGFVHRNVSSDNIFINSADQVSLFEFGSACHYTDGADSCAFSNIPYISPEASNRARQHPGEDAWALGLLISEMLTGRFIRERAGDANIPIHCKAEALSELMSDISFFSSSRIGKICAQLLNPIVAHRMTMVEVVALLSPVEASQASTQASQASTQAPSSASSQVSTPRQNLR